MIQLGLLERKTSTLGVVSELLLFSPDLCNDSLVRIPDRLNSEQTVHALERNGLCLWNEEEDKDDGNDHHACEEHVDAEAVLAHLEEHLRREAGDDEVPEPIVGGGGSLTEGTRKYQ